MSQTLIIFTLDTKNQHVRFRFWYLLWPLCKTKSKTSLNPFSGEPNELWHWLSSQMNKELKAFCVDKNLESIFDKSATEKNSFVKGPFFCPQDGSNVKFQGQLNSKNLPNGNGRFQAQEIYHQPKYHSKITQVYRLKKFLAKGKSAMVDWPAGTS